MVAGSASGVHWKQFIAECGIEYGYQIVTQFFLNPPDCLYTKKSCEFLQSYGKSSAKQRNLFLFLPRRSNFATLLAKLRKKLLREHKKNVFLFSDASFLWNKGCGRLFVIDDNHSPGSVICNILTFVSMLTSWNLKPHRGLIEVASQFCV